MQFLIVAGLLTYVITLYFMRNPLKHTRQFMWRRFLSWFPLGMTYAFIYLARYNVDALATAEILTKAEKSYVSGWGFLFYAASLFVTGPLIDRIGGKRGMIMAALGAAIANTAMGWILYLHLHGDRSFDLVFWLSAFYSINMFFQSFGAISTIKVKSFWFHVRERGTFGAIFGTLISLGVYFAFDWSEAISSAVNVNFTGEPTAFRNFMQSAFNLQGSTVSAYWLLFFIPSGLLVLWAFVDIILIKDSPDQCGFGKLDTHDASSGQSTDFDSWWLTIKSVFQNRVLLMIGVIEFTSGVLRDGIMKWYRLFSRENPEMMASWIYHDWGLWACVTGIAGGFLAGWSSDRFFHSRRAPVAGVMQAIMFVCVLSMILTVSTNSTVFGIAALIIMAAVIGVHSIMSGTATADFGGRKAAATATGVADGFSKLGSSFQEFVLGAIIVKETWIYWPSFLLPFTVLGLFFAIKLWRELPEATKKYLREVEKLKVK